jgi:DNA-directed RNA polymerase specialized sigma24 family protein
MDELLKYMKALVALQSRAILETQPGMKLELVLRTAGLNYREIAEILGKTEAAVAKTITRSR